MWRARAKARSLSEARWRSGYAEDCKSLHAGSIPARASNIQINPIVFNGLGLLSIKRSLWPPTPCSRAGETKTRVNSEHPRFEFALLLLYSGRAALRRCLEIAKINWIQNPDVGEERGHARRVPGYNAAQTVEQRGLSDQSVI